MSCGVGRRHSSELAMAIALTRTLAWEPPYAMGAGLKRQKKKTKKKKICLHGPEEFPGGTSLSSTLVLGTESYSSQQSHSIWFLPVSILPQSLYFGICSRSPEIS